MAEQFKCRFEIIRETSTLPTEWIDAVEAAIRDVVDHDKLDNESVGLLVSHVVASLDRIHKGNSLTDGPGYELMTEIKSQVPNAEPEAARIVNSIEEWIGLTLPDSEKQYVTLHIANVMDKE